MSNMFIDNINRQYTMLITNIYSIAKTLILI